MKNNLFIEVKRDGKSYVSPWFETDEQANQWIEDNKIDVKSAGAWIQDNIVFPLRREGFGEEYVPE